MTRAGARRDEPTAAQFSAYRAMFDHFNRELFDGSLTPPLLNLSRGPQRTVAFFAPNRWKHNATESTTTHEISLNPRHLADGSAFQTAQSLVHEMVHLWQHAHGKPALSAHGMSDEVIHGGAFARAFAGLPSEAHLPWSCLEAHAAPPRPAPGGEGEEGEGEEGEGEGEAVEPPKSRNKVKYTCPSCGANVWGKPDLVLACLDGHDPALLLIRTNQDGDAPAGLDREERRSSEAQS